MAHPIYWAEPLGLVRDCAWASLCCQLGHFCCCGKNTPTKENLGEKLCFSILGHTLTISEQSRQAQPQSRAKRQMHLVYCRLALSYLILFRSSGQGVVTPTVGQVFSYQLIQVALHRHAHGPTWCRYFLIQTILSDDPRLAFKTSKRLHFRLGQFGHLVSLAFMVGHVPCIPGEPQSIFHFLRFSSLPTQESAVFGFVCAFFLNCLLSVLFWKSFSLIFETQVISSVNSHQHHSAFQKYVFQYLVSHTTPCSTRNGQMS